MARKPKPTAKSGAPLKEWHLQAAAVKWLRRYRQVGWPIRVAGDMNSARRTLREQGHASATGINAGEPDVRVYLPQGKLLLIEFKRSDGTTSDEQDEAHLELTNLGHDVVVLAPSSEDEAIELTTALVSSRLGLPIPHWEPPANDNRPV
ncbi:hypothetical protein [Bosea sp. AS-1]|uniref:hypothetical protein n=1 Tax=Bosea sp. AS-1 TaxID=2015316 RepID=UPI000B7945AE|nr:hypothetical protein [Bosea sp. AS-1]